MSGYGWPFAFGERVVFVSFTDDGDTDELGNTVLTRHEHPVDGCAVWPSGPNSEDVQASARVADELAVAGPVDLPVDAFSEFTTTTYPDVYRITGVPERWRNPLTGATPAGLVIGKAVTG